MNSKYGESGVDIDAAGRALKNVSGTIKDTWSKNVLSETGNFGGLFRMPDEYSEPVLVSSVDGVGTKLKVAFLSGIHNTVGEDLVNHCVNDILVQGASPLFFLDYLGCGRLNPEILADVIAGFARGCKNNGCALIGGETAEMPGFYSGEEYDLAGSIVGVVEKSDIIDGSRIKSGDAIWAFPSSGLHTNGYSLARKIIFEDEKLGLDDIIPGTGKRVVEELLEVHRSYLNEFNILSEYVSINGLAHITGGGIIDNIPRILPEDVSVEIDTASWDVPALFEFLARRGEVSKGEMFRVFNMGVGMVVIIPAEDEVKISQAKGLRWDPFRIGRVIRGDRDVRLI
ncbi:phosphoribosylformylglycinamidine cyclo-ligase [bacterium]|nr:phosphoribosylformylglycinamidine cyclo-ligase [bacterium]